MKRSHLIGLIVFSVICFLAITFTGYTKVPAGYEGVKINTLGSGKGALKNVGVGRHFYTRKYEFELFPLFKQNYVWTKSKQEGSPNDESITFQSMESLVFNADVGISYSVQKGKSAHIYESYHKGVEELTDVDMRNSVRDAFNRLGSGQKVEGIYGAGKADFIASIHSDVSTYWDKQGVTIHKIYLVGEMRPPSAVKKSIASKIAATQIAQQRRNEVATEAAADKKIEAARGDSTSKKLLTDAKAYDILERATAEAKSIALIQKQLARSPQYLEYLKTTQWDGKLPYYMGAGAPLPMITLNK